MVYLKRLLRKIGVDIKFDWPDSMIAVSRLALKEAEMGIDCHDQAIKAIIDERTTYSEKSRPDLLQHLIDEGEKPDSGMKMVPRDVIDQMSEVLLAGSETTSGTIGCFFLEVLRDPRVKARLLETLPVLQPNDSIVTCKAVRTDSQYEYLEACIKETLRLHPIASEMGRRTLNQSIELMGFSLPPHTVVCASYRDLHRNSAYWPDPLRFWPERWLQNRPPDVPPPRYVPGI
jgi:cytochrome P450